MSTFRKYGKEPYSIVTIHGGPGAPGGMAYLANIISEKHGVLEPFQTANSIKGQVQELYSVIKDHCLNLPVRLIGHSWGAWLAYIFTENFPGIVNKLILIGAGAFEEKYNADFMKIRLNRLNKSERREAQHLINILVMG